MKLLYFLNQIENFRTNLNKLQLNHSKKMFDLSNQKFCAFVFTNVYG